MHASPNLRRSTQAVNAVIDRALRQPTAAHFRAVLRLHPATARSLAERARRRATALGRHAPRQRAEIVAARDRLMLAIYADATPAGWHTAWCDGSVSASQDAAGIGGLLMDPGGDVMAVVARHVSDLAPFEAEIAALVAILEIARGRAVKRVRVHTDCVALARLWKQSRDDPRLAEVLTLARGFQRIELCGIPRLHNQPAHRLARSGAEVLPVTRGAA